MRNLEEEIAVAGSCEFGNEHHVLGKYRYFLTS